MVSKYLTPQYSGEIKPMNNAIKIAALVAGYSLFEAAVILMLLYPERPEVFAGWTLVVIIPGTAALMSRLAYGPHRCLRRTLMIIAGFWVIPAPLTLLLLVGAFLAWVFTINTLLFYALLPLVLGAVFLGLFLTIRKLRRRSIQLNAASRLSELQSGTNRGDRKWRSRGLRLASCFPALTVLIVFLWLPELWGTVTHLTQPHAGNLSGYRVPIPVGWIIFESIPPTSAGESFVAGFHLQGIHFDVKPYLE